ncbi:MAG TPA: DUF4105 domain-containing protein [Gemmatimonadales bacterium]|nr:DUF4105 domain-containing protein [Gemmatimonadales bacterium]
MKAPARVALAAGLTAAVPLAWLAVTQPSLERAWSPDHAQLPRAVFDGDTVRLSGVRHFSYGRRGEVRPAYASRTLDLSRLESVWFVLVPLSARLRAPAHSFVTFGFADSQYVGISVEARREVGETYGVIAGLFRRYELIYVVADERDLLTRRVLHDGAEVYLYPIRASRDKVRELFVAMLGRTNQLAERPEFYNTAVNNCTSNLVAHVNAIAPGRIPAGIRTVLPGYADEVALELGLIEGGATLEAVRRRFRASERVARHAEAADFSRRIRDVAERR